MAILEINGRNGFKGGELEINADPIIIFVNGYFNNSYIQKDLFGFSDGKSKMGYWGLKLQDNVKKYINTNKAFFINGADTSFSSGSKRFNNGKEYASSRLKNSSSTFCKEVIKKKRKVMIVSHSMGGAFAEGILSILKKENINVVKVLHLSPADTSDFSVTYPKITYQIDISFDPVLTYKNLNDSDYITGIKHYGLIQNPDHDQYGHANTKIEGYVIDWFKDLESIELSYNKTEIRYQRIPSDGFGPATTIKHTIKLHTAKGNTHNTQYIKLKKTGIIYHYNSKNIYETY